MTSTVTLTGAALAYPGAGRTPRAGRTLPPVVGLVDLSLSA